jgi:hypothetical protein
MDDQKTQEKRPIPPRPRWGWFAWEATVGYIHDEYSPDAMLTLTMLPSAGVVMWGASLQWGEHHETVRDRVGFAIALGDLWRQVAAHHQIFKTLEAATRRPEGYDDDNWVDLSTLDVLTRLVGVTSTVFKEDWMLFVTYRPISVSNYRLQARLVARGVEVVRAGRGATLRDACRNLYHNATPDYKRYYGQQMKLS